LLTRDRGAFPVSLLTSLITIEGTRAARNSVVCGEFQCSRSQTMRLPPTTWCSHCSTNGVAETQNSLSQI